MTLYQPLSARPPEGWAPRKAALGIPLDMRRDTRRVPVSATAPHIGGAACFSGLFAAASPPANIPAFFRHFTRTPAMSTVKKYNWNDVHSEQLTPLLSRKMITGERLMIAEVLLSKGSICSAHDHHNEDHVHREGCLRSGLAEHADNPETSTSTCTPVKY